MLIKRLKPADAASYWNLRLEALKRHPEAFLTSYEEAVQRENPLQGVAANLEKEENYTFGAFENGSLIGMVTLLIETREKIKHKANLFAMYVSTEERGKGIGRALLQEAIEKAQALKEIEQINLTVVKTNTEASRLYQDMGFRSFGTETNALKLEDVYYDEDHMVLFI
ncbi:GNAT family N-acetyltransferase [Virgibacillus halodenitrificans]|nr:GNAT family N-acetyltransferase [Virgibacillus halodenitrificans]